MKLFINQTSPYARKVRVVVRELALDVTLIDVDPWQDPPQLLAVSPLSKVPVLVADDGLVLTESDAIARYLALAAKPGTLLPAENSQDGTTQSAAMAARIALVQGMIDAAFDAVIEKRRPAPQQWPEWISRQQRALQRGLARLAETPPPAKRFDLGDISLACLLGYVDFRHADIAWRAQYPSLAAWFDQVSQRPSLRATHPDLPIA